MVPSSKALGPTSSLGRYVDRLVQTFEDCRGGLTDTTIAGGEEAVEAYFLELYTREGARLDETIRDQPLLPKDAQAQLRSEVDERIRKVIIPAYVRLAVKFTPKERADFYLTEERFHALERIGFGVAGILIGIFVIVVPFIPLWSDFWVLPFMLAGLLFPNIRRYLSLRRYEDELNHLVARADRDFARLDIAYLTNGDDLEAELAEAAEAQERPAHEEETDAEGTGEEPEKLRDRLARMRAQRDKEN